MTDSAHRLYAAAAVLGAALLTAENAHAYIDPGTGTLLIQWLFGMIFAGLALMKMYWARAKMFITSKLGKDSGIDDAEPEAPEAEEPR